MRLVAAGRALCGAGRHERDSGPRDRRRRADHEPDSPRGGDDGRALIRSPGPLQRLSRLARALRHRGGVAVPRRGNDRREMEHQPPGDGGVRAGEPPPRAAGHRGRLLQTRDRSHRRPRAGRDAAPRHDAREDGDVPRLGTTLEKMATLEPLTPGGRITAAVSSQIADAAAALLIASESAVERFELEPRARIHHLSVRGADPIWMLTAPIPATRQALARSGLKLGDIDLFEINEAFASVVLAWQRELDADLGRVNVNGGAIALGHPIGATGARLMTSLLHELERRGARYGLQTMCEGGGQANVTIIERLA